jgi:transcriptional regulator with XRE-family HTH domain
MRNWKTLDAFERELLEDDEFREEYEKREPEYRIAREILATRRSIGMSQQVLARLIGTSQSRISMWERGEELPRLDNLQRIADATGSTLHVSLEPTVSPGRAGKSRRVTRESAVRKKTGRKTTSGKTAGKRASARKSTRRKKASGRKVTSGKSPGKRVAARKSTARKRTTERTGASRKAAPRRSGRS